MVRLVHRPTDDKQEERECERKRGALKGAVAYKRISEQKERAAA